MSDRSYDMPGAWNEMYQTHEWSVNGGRDNLVAPGAYLDEPSDNRPLDGYELKSPYQTQKERHLNMFAREAALREQGGIKMTNSDFAELESQLDSEAEMWDKWLVRPLEVDTSDYVFDNVKQEWISLQGIDESRPEPMDGEPYEDYVTRLYGQKLNKQAQQVADAKFSSDLSVNQTWQADAVKLVGTKEFQQFAKKFNEGGHDFEVAPHITRELRTQIGLDSHSSRVLAAYLYLNDKETYSRFDVEQEG